MVKKIGELFATDFMKLEFEYDKDRLKEDILIIKALWFNSQYGEWEELQQVFLPINKMDEIIKILNKARDISTHS